ncbi:MAG TPA: FAD:protein FMN transferase [Candidatus Saccharimonadales bacterium]|nr:FAD:protein FMN transferase [Candidatus Saccharimonadales bacterium]
MKFEINSGFRALGTDINIRIVFKNETEKEKAEGDLEKAKNIFFSKEKIFSRFDFKSELCRINKNTGIWQKATPDMLYLAGRALYYNEISGGLYDPRVIEVLEKIGYDKDFKKKDFSKADLPSPFSAIRKKLADDLKIGDGKIFFATRMDLSGIANGYIVDCAAQYLKRQGWKNFLVDAGGDMNISGTNDEEKKWRIAVEGVPEEKLMLEISGKGIATSGISRKKWQIKGKKFHHLVNPNDPNNFSYEMRTVSVIAQNTENADGRAKTLVLMGKEKGLEFAKENKIAAIFLDYKGNIFVSPEAKKYVYPNIQC